MNKPDAAHTVNPERLSKLVEMLCETRTIISYGIKHQQIQAHGVISMLTTRNKISRKALAALLKEKHDIVHPMLTNSNGAALTYDEVAGALLVLDPSRESKTPVRSPKVKEKAE